MSLIKNIIWGKKTEVSPHELKYAMLRGEFAIIIKMVGLFYIFLDTYNGVTVFIPWYLLMMSIASVAVILNRKRYYTASTVLILFIINFQIYIFADVDHPEGGVFFYFMTSSMAGLILMSYYQSRLALVFALLPVVLGYLAYFFDLNVVPPPVYTQPMLMMNFLSNFTIGLLATVFMLQFLLNRNKESEEILVNQNALLEKANKELDHFVYSVSHDLRAPLSSILGLTTIYHMGRSEEEKANVVRMIQDRAQTLDKFIREVLDYSRNTRVELRLQPTNVYQIIEESVKGMLFIEGAKDVAVDIQVDRDLAVSTDRERIKVVLSNLISNAIYYRDPNKQSSVVIRSFIENKHWIIAIKDNGIGIQKEHLSRIFEMFYKAHDRAQGTGLGLYIVKETLQRLRGVITVDSAYGVGTTFAVKLKLDSQ